MVHSLLRRAFFFAAAAVIAGEPPLEWHEVATWGVEGRAFAEAERSRWFDRLPAAANGKVPSAVWGHSRDSAGMLVRFRTDAPTIWASYTLLKDRPVSSNKTGISTNGIDLYARDPAGKWRWAGVCRPNGKIVRQRIVEGMAPALREYAAYLPLFNGVDDLKLGVPPGAKFEPLPPRSAQPIVFYGTSISHGSSASRAGMPHSAILGRRLEMPVVNLGFSGHGRMDASVGEFLAQIDAAVYVIDCLPNMDARLVRERCPALVRQLRSARPEVPIVLVEDRRNPNAWVLPERNAHHTANHAALRTAFEALRKEGVAGLHYIPGDDLLGNDGEGSTDGSHPNDLGFMRQAEAFEPVLRAALGLR